MIQVILSDKVIIGPNEEEIFSLDLQTIRQKAFGTDKVLVYDANLNGLDKAQLEFAIENATREIKVFTNSSRPIDGKRSTAKLKIDRGDDQRETDPWAITKAIFEASDRKELFEYLKENKVNLWMPLLIMISNYDKLSPGNMKVLERIEGWYIRVQNEILYSMISFGMKAQRFDFPRWRFPKKSDEKKSKKKKSED